MRKYFTNKCDVSSGGTKYLKLFEFHVNVIVDKHNFTIVFKITAYLFFTVSTLNLYVNVHSSYLIFNCLVVNIAVTTDRLALEN